MFFSQFDTNLYPSQGTKGLNYINIHHGAIKLIGLANCSFTEEVCSSNPAGVNGICNS